MATEFVFISNYTAHRLVRRPKHEIPTVTGAWITRQDGVSYQFEPWLDRDSGKLVGILRVKAGQDKLDTDAGGWLKPGEEYGIERDAPTALMAHRAFQEDFWLHGFPPGTKLPRPQEWRADIRQASVDLNEELLVKMIADERRTHGREDLISEAQDALDLIRGALAAAQERAEAEAAPPKAKAAAKA
jgi:hypothetical protein